MDLHQEMKKKKKKTAFNNSRTRTEKVKVQAASTEANKQVKRSIKADKQKYVEELAVEEAKREGNVKQLYYTTKKLAAKHSKLETGQGQRRQVNHSESGTKELMGEQFDKLLNKLAPLNPLNIEAAHTDLPNEVTPLTTEEIRMAIRKIKSDKAAGSENI
ncbi:unnamed protein product [Schistosoma mattheei]|uniref:Uncharacterized protein n=1 Tax=Schistosoma mattheei TaxID=31246 RepID=A0A183NY48_9TREM|nr:unnamed protein product [Schistosoma mattheei]